MKRHGMRLVIMIGCVGLMAGLGACGKKKDGKGGGEKIATKEVTFKLGNTFMVKGQMPAKWTANKNFMGVPQYIVKDGIMVVARIDFAGHGCSKCAADKLKALVEEQYKKSLQKMFGHVGEKVVAPTKVREGVWTYVTKRKDDIAGPYAYSVDVNYAEPDWNGTFTCRGWARGKKAGLWKAMRRICENVKVTNIYGKK